ncbi:hypothetical protein [Microbulbifer sp. 2304DJ12-6]|uniref:hypothetical protein n=1 Tax=Microbulbifer sp. 2304DJ12-6 TaxID=3233340 RepID=UPI0039AFA285
MNNGCRAIKVFGAVLFSAGFLCAVFQHFTVDSWTKVSVANQVGLVRDTEKMVYTKEELEQYVMQAVVDRAGRVQGPLPPSMLMLFGVGVILVSNRFCSK